MLVSVTPTLGSNILPSTWTVSLLDKNSNGIIETASFSVEVTDTPDNVQSFSDAVILVVVTQIIYNTTSQGSSTSLAAYSPVAAVSFGITNLTLTATPALTLLVPSLSMTLAVSTTIVEAKQVVHVTITVSASSSPSPGYDISVASLIPPQLHVVANTLAITGTGQGQTIYNGNGTDSINVSAGFVKLSKGGSISIQFDTTVDSEVLSGTTITISSNLAYCSSPAAYGRGCYTASQTKVLNVTPPAVGLSVFNTSLLETVGNSATIGEQVVYHATLTYPKGNAFNGVFIILLPTSAAQQTVLTNSVIFIGANFNVTSIPAGVQSTSTVQYTIPSLKNDPDASNANGNVIIFEIIALVTNSSSNINTATYPTYATLTYYGNPYSANTQIKVVLPSLSISKSHATASSYVDAYTVVNYALTVAHAGSTSPAYNTTISDLLPNTLSLDTGSVQVSVGASVTTTSNSLQITIGTFLVSAPAIVVTYSAVIQPNVLASQYIVNNANATYVSAPPDSYNSGNIRNFAIFTSHSVAVSAPTVAFKLGLLSTSLTETTDPSVAIGETITIPIEIVVPRGVTKNAIVNVTLPTSPGKLKAIVGDVVVIPPYTTSSLSEGDNSVNSDASGDGIQDVYTFNFGDIVDIPSGDTNNTITLLVTTVVSADSTTNNSDILVSKAAITYYNGTDTLTQSATFSVTVVEPLLALTGSSATTYTSHIGSGTTVKYTLTLSNVPGASGSTGPSYYVEIYDGLDPRLSLVYGTVSTTSGNVTEGNNPYDTVVRVRPATILPTQTVTITFNATLLDTVEASTTVNTNATYKYSSSWYQTYNSDDVRNRSSYTTLHVTATSPKVAFGLNYTTIPETQGTTVTIGEAASIVTTLSVPKGSTNGAVLTLAVPKTTVKMQMIYARIAFLEPSLGITAYSVGQYVPLTDTNADKYNDTAALDFGTIFNPSGGIEFSAPTVAAIVEFIGLVLNIDGNTNSSALSSTMNFGYGSSAHYSLPAQSVILTEALPLLQVLKTASHSTYLEAGSSIRYTVVVSHATGSASPAFNISVFDPLSPYHKLQTSTVTTSSGTVEVGSNPSDTFIRISPATLSVGGSVTITYNTTFTDSLPPNTPIVNTVNATYYTAPPGTWNTGNIRNATAFDSATVTTAAPSVALSLSTTSIPQTPSSNVTIGEIVTFLATVKIPHGVTQGATLNITLPTSAGKLGVISANISTMSTYLSSSLSRSKGYTATPIDSNGDGILDVVSFSFGTLSNPFDGTFESSNGTIVLQIQALVVNSALNTNLALLTTSASFYYSNGTSTFQAGPSNVGITVVLPALSLVKTATAPSYAEAGSVIAYTLTIRHNATASTSPAFNLSVVDLLSSPYLSLVSGSVRVSAGSIVSGNAVSDTIIYLAPPTILLTDVITVTYNATLNPATISGSSVPNNATVSYASAISTPDNNNGKDVYYGSASGSAKVVVSPPSLLFALGSASLSEISAPNVTIGETVTLRATIVIPAGYTDLASLKVTLPNLPNGQLSAIYGSVVSVPPVINATYSSAFVTPTQHGGFNDTVTFSFGTFSNPHDGVTQGPSDTIIVDILALVVNSSANSGGVLTTSASFSYFNGASTVSIPKSVTLAVALPQLSISKDATVPAYLQAGDIIQYTITASHTRSSASPAYTLLVTDLLSAPSLKLVAGSVISSKGGVVTGNSVADTIVAVDPAEFLSIGGTLVITYNATVTSAAETATLVHNSASATYSSSSSNPYNNNNIRVTTISTEKSVLVAAPNLTFVLANTSLLETTGSNVAIGESATYTASILLPHGTTNNVVVVVTLPSAKLQVVASRVTYLPVNTQSSTLSLGVSGTASDSNLDGINDTVTFNLGTVVSAPSVLADTNRVDVQVTSVVSNIAANVAGMVLSSNAVLTYGETQSQVNPPSVSVVVVEPDLVLSKTSDVSVVGGDQYTNITYTITVAYSASSSNAYELDLSDTIPNSLALVQGSVRVSSGQASTSGGVITVSLASLPTDTTVTLTYVASLVSTVLSGAVIINTASLHYVSAPTITVPFVGAARAYSTNTSAQVYVGDPILESFIVYSKTLDSLDPDFASAPPTYYFTVGEVITFHLVASLPDEPNPFINLAQRIPFSSFSVLNVSTVLGGGVTVGSSATNLVNGNMVWYNFTTVANTAVGGTITLEVQVVVTNVSDNQFPAKFATTGFLFSSHANSSRDINLSIVQPSLMVATTVTPVNVEAGDVVTYTTTISHAADSTTIAYLVSLEDIGSDSVRVVAGTVTASTGTVVAGNNPDEFVAIQVLQLGLQSTVTVTYNATILVPALLSSVHTNDVTLGYQSAPATSLNVGNVRYLEQKPAPATLTLAPPSFDLQLGNTSNSEVSGNLVLVGENATFAVTVDVPYGTLLEPSLRLSVEPNSTSTLILLSSAPRIANTTSTFNTSNSLSNVTSNYGFSSVVSQLGGSKKMVFSFDSVILPTNVTSGTNLTVTSQLTYSNGTYNFTLPTQTSTLVVGITKFGLVQTCTPTKLHIFSTAQCTITVYSIVQLPAYNLTISNAKMQYFSLNNYSVVSSHGSVAYDLNGGFAVQVPVYDPRNNANITVVYTLSAMVNTNSDVLVPAFLSYLSSPTIYAASTAQNATSIVTIKVNGGGMNGGVIAGIVIGSIGGAAILGAAAFALFKKKMIPVHNPFARTASLNPSAVVEDNPIYGGDRFANVNNPLYQNTSL